MYHCRTGCIGRAGLGMGAKTGTVVPWQNSGWVGDHTATAGGVAAQSGGGLQDVRGSGNAVGAGGRARVQW